MYSFGNINDFDTYAGQLVLAGDIVKTFTASPLTTVKQAALIKEMKSILDVGIDKVGSTRISSFINNVVKHVSNVYDLKRRKEAGEFTKISMPKASAPVNAPVNVSFSMPSLNSILIASGIGMLLLVYKFWPKRGI